MTWTYRIVRYRDGSGFGLHVVFYDDDGLPQSMTTEPISFTAGADEDAVKEMAADLKLALKDVTTRPVLDEPAPGEWPGKAPDGK